MISITALSHKFYLRRQNMVNNSIKWACRKRGLSITPGLLAHTLVVEADSLHIQYAGIQFLGAKRAAFNVMERMTLMKGDVIEVRVIPADKY